MWIQRRGGEGWMNWEIRTDIYIHYICKTASGNLELAQLSVCDDTDGWDGGRTEV